MEHMVESISERLKQKVFNSLKDPRHINVDFFEFSLSFSIREFVGYTAFSWRVEVSRESVESCPFAMLSIVALCEEA